MRFMVLVPRAADLCDNGRERELLLSRAVACGT